jgi:hypothetical protein
LYPSWRKTAIVLTTWCVKDPHQGSLTASAKKKIFPIWCCIEFLVKNLIDLHPCLYTVMQGNTDSPFGLQCGSPAHGRRRVCLWV